VVLGYAEWLRGFSLGVNKNNSFTRQVVVMGFYGRFLSDSFFRSCFRGGGHGGCWFSWMGRLFWGPRRSVGGCDSGGLVVIGVEMEWRW
jgi:hypothetical protein